MYIVQLLLLITSLIRCKVAYGSSRMCSQYSHQMYTYKYSYCIDFVNGNIVSRQRNTIYFVSELQQMIQKMHSRPYLTWWCGYVMDVIMEGVTSQRQLSGLLPRMRRIFS